MIVNKLFLNGNHTKNPNNSLAFARNVRFDDDFENLINEPGFELLHTLPENICGIIPTDKELIVFCTNDNGTDYIYRVSEQTATLSLKGSLGFSINTPIKGVYSYNNRYDLIVCFNNGVGDLKVFNFDSPYMDINQTTKEFTNATDGLNKLKLVPDYKVPYLFPMLFATNQKGTLPKGTYQFIMSYYIGDFDRLNWSIPSETIYIANSRSTKMEYNSTQEINGSSYTTYFSFNEYYQTASEVNSNKSIQLYITGIDTNFKKYKLAVIHRTDTDTKVYDLGDYLTSITIHDVKTLSDIELSLDEVTIPNVNYKDVADITISNDRLALLGVTSKGLIDYQKYANNIKVSYTTVDFNSILGNTYVESLKIPIFDEVYALNIGLVGKDGLVKGIFHIPGRAPQQYITGTMENSLLTPSQKIAYQQADGNNITEIIKPEYVYQLYNTADSIFQTDRKLAYWENQNEVYPTTDSFQICDVDSNGNTVVIGSLGGQKVRHHKMPDVSKLFVTNDYPNKVLGLNFSDIKFPKEMLDEIQGFFIAFSNRDSANTTVHAYHPLIRNNFWKPFTGSTDDTIRTPSLGLHNYTFSNSAIRFNDFGLLTFKPALSNLYLKGVYKTNKLETNNNVVSDFVPVKSLTSGIRDVTDYKYLPRDNSAADPNNKGREEALVLRVNTLYNDTNDMLVCALKSHTNNLFIPFYDQKVSITSGVKQLEPNVYSYSLVDIRGFDGYMSWYHNTIFRGDQTFEIDDSGDSLLVTRHDGDGDNNDTTALNAYRCLNITPVNTNVKTMELERTDSNVEDNRTTIANLLDDITFGWLGKEDEAYSIRSNILVNPASANNISYNKNYSFTNSIVGYYVYNYNNVFVNQHPYRVARSTIQNKESLTLGWRYFPALDYYEMPKYRGIGKSILGQDKMLLIHMEHSLFVAQVKDVLTTPEGTAYIGSGDLFDRKPDELIPTGRGTAGIQSRFGNCIGEFGYVFADTYDQNIYAYNNNSLEVISDDSVRALYKKYMEASTGNPLISSDVVLGVDHTNKRIIISNLSTNFTLSYCYNSQTKGWVSFHDYTPVILVNNRVGTYTVDKTNLKKLYKFNTWDNGTYANGIKYESYIDVLINDNPRIDKVLNSVSFKSGLNNEVNNIHKLFVYTRNQCSKIYSLAEFNLISDYDKLRYLGGFWNYDLIRDYTNTPIIQNIVSDFGSINMVSINENKLWYELSDISDRFIIVRLITNNSTDMVFRDLEYNVMLNRR